MEIVEAAVVMGLHILREHFRESIEGYAQVFKKLMECNVVSRDVGEVMIRFVRLRNLIVHRYWEVDNARMYREVREEELRIARRFVEEVKSFVSRA